MKLLYNSGLIIYKAVIQLAAWSGNTKAGLWVNGRKDWKNLLKSSLKKQGKVYWFHCSSLGEFEQGRPLIEAIRFKEPTANILLTFFSPSGYEIRKDYSIADCVTYLPLDGYKNAEQFLDIVNPTAVFFIKYDYWYHYLHSLKHRQTPVYLVSAVFRKKQHFFSWYGGFFRNMLRNVSHFFLQDESSGELLDKIGIHNYSVTGDTRFDRVLENSEHITPLPLLKSFKADNAVIVCGSTWPADEEIIISAYLRMNNVHLKLVIAPHDISQDRIDHLKNKLGEKLNPGEVQLFSKADAATIENCRILILDTMGQLSNVYSYGTLAYVGGGFGNGIHNTLEPAAHGIPVIFGPRHEKFREAAALIKERAGFSVKTSNEFILLVESMLQRTAWLESSGKAAINYIQTNAGATNKIMDVLKII